MSEPKTPGPERLKLLASAVAGRPVTVAALDPPGTAAWTVIVKDDGTDAWVFEHVFRLDDVVVDGDEDAGLFGQPNSAHYAAAKAALLGLTNVIAIEGAEHGILANTVLPFGYSRMVTETIGELPEDSEFLHAIDPQWVVPIVTYLSSKACDVSHHNYSACAGRFARVFVGLAEGWLAG